MTRIADNRSILALDPNSRGLAFVFFENGILLDWGTRRKDGEELSLLADLLDRYKVDVLILEDPYAPRCERRARMRQLLQSMAEHAATQGVSVVAISRDEVRRAWIKEGISTKHGVATSIAATLNELEPLMPRKRKPYRSEEARTDIFDAASLALHAFGVIPEAER